MPLVKGKSQKSFVKNLKTEMEAGKPQKQSLAIAYAMKRKAEKKKMAEGGKVDQDEMKFPDPGPMTDYVSQPEDKKNFPTRAIMTEAKKKADEAHYDDGGPVLDPAKLASAEDSMRKAFHYADGGQITDNYQSPDYTLKALMDPDNQKSGFMTHEGDVKRPNHAAMAEDHRALNQHGEYEEGEQGGGQGFHGESYMGNQGDAHDQYQSTAHEMDMVGRIMAQRQKMYSEGGRVANQDHGPNNNEMAGFSPNEFDDLVLRDDLESTYGEDNNAGDENDNAQENEDRRDIVSRIMKSRRKTSSFPPGYKKITGV